MIVISGDVEPGISEVALRGYFGEHWDAVRSFHRILALEGDTRGLIGPREAGRLWRRHILNSAALALFLPEAGTVADIGSGAGLPGMVLALMRPDLRFHLVEPMQRRTRWLEEVTARLSLANVEIHESRAEQLHGALRVDAVTARAVAPLPTLAGWAVPLLVADGRVVVLKGRRASDEVAAARPVLRRLRWDRVALHEVDVLSLGDPTTVVELLPAPH